MPAHGLMPTAAGRAITAELGFAFGGGRTFLQHQRVPYPFHITRPHALDPERPDIATLILQSAAGGLYPNDRLNLIIAAGTGASAQVVTQSATVVHAAPGHGASLTTTLSVARGAFLSVISDPFILFPGAALDVRTDITLGPKATLVTAEGFSTHDPTGAGRPLSRLATQCRIRADNGTLLVNEAGVIDGDAFAGPHSPLGPYQAMGTVMVIGEAAQRLDVARLNRDLNGFCVLAGATLLPNGAGLCVRVLALAGGALVRVIEFIVARTFEASFGRFPPARRR